MRIRGSVALSIAVIILILVLASACASANPKATYTVPPAMETLVLKVSMTRVGVPIASLGDEKEIIPSLMFTERAWMMLNKWSDRDWYDYGVCLDLGWVTSEGMAVT